MKLCWEPSYSVSVQGLISNESVLTTSSFSLPLGIHLRVNIWVPNNNNSITVCWKHLCTLKEKHQMLENKTKINHYKTLMDLIQHSNTIERKTLIYGCRYQSIFMISPDPPNPWQLERFDLTTTPEPNNIVGSLMSPFELICEGDGDKAISSMSQLQHNHLSWERVLYAQPAWFYWLI